MSELRKSKTNEQKESVSNESEKAAQTDPLILYPYEHLFPNVLPHPIHTYKQDIKSYNMTEEYMQPDSLKNPYDILDNYIQHACDKVKYTTLCNEDGKQKKKAEDEISILKAELGMLHNQVQFERHRREMLGDRNRRLLGKTKSSQILEETNKALKDQLIMRESEITTLRDQLEQVRREKHEVEEERAANAKQRDKEIEKLVKENGQLKQSNLELENQVIRQKRDETNARSEINKLQSALFKSKSEIDVLLGKAEGKVKAEAELVNLRKEVLLLGELLHRSREQMSKASFGESEQERLFRVAYQNQISQMETALNSAKSEMEVARGRAQDLEAMVIKKDEVIAAQKVLHEKILEEYDAKKPEAEEAYNNLLVQNLQLEQRILELNNEIDRSASGMRSRQGQGGGHHRVTSSGSLSSQSNRSLIASPTSPGYGDISGSMSGVFSGHGKSKVTTVTANVDMPPPRQLAVPRVEKSSFIIGSPPSSSDGGSIGSANSALIQRALSESGGPINLESGPLTHRGQGCRRQSQGIK